MQVNQYFDGNVTSLALENSAGRQTVGVMQPGEYRFNTDVHEVMIVVSGALTVKRADDADFQTYSAGQRFEVPAQQAFDVKIAETSAYLCSYAD